MACKDLDFLWKECFREPFHFQDHQRGPVSPDFRRKQSSVYNPPPWTGGLHKPPWIKRSGKSKDGEPSGGKGNRKAAVLKVPQNFQDRTALFDLIKACGKHKDLRKGSSLHAAILERGLLKNDIALNNALLSMYARCGALSKAREIFDQLSARNVITWNALITAYIQHGLGDEALICFERMLDEGLSPNAVTFISILKACGSIGAAGKGKEIHDEVSKQGLLEKDIVLGTALVDMYAKCGVLAKAQEVFDKLPARNVTTWTALITGYVQHGLGNEALSCFGRMQDDGLFPDTVTFICILGACGSIGAVERGKEIHAEVSRQGLLEKDIVLGNALVDMYAKCGALAEAQEVLDELPTRDVTTWTALIAGYAEHGLADEAISCFGRMKDEGFSPNAVTFICTLKACGSLGAVDLGEDIHAEVNRQGLLEKDNVLGTALVDMYAKCGVFAKAQDVLDKLLERNVVTWNALIAGYAQHGLGDEALSCYGRMQEEGLFPDAITFICILKACGSIGAAEQGKEIHDKVSKQGLLEKDAVLGTAVVDMYAKCGALAKAQRVFDKLPARSLVMWNALIAGYSQHGLGDEALSCFERMRDEGLSPDVVTFISILKACSSIGAAEKGEEIHAEVGRQGLLGNDIVLGTALVDMYAKCGKLAKAQKVFDKLPARGVATWTALIAGYAQAGKVKTVFDSFIKMIGEGIEPSIVTFVVLLSACSHEGLVEEGEMYFDIMNTVYHIAPTSEHRTCMVDILSRAGHFDKAISMIQKVPPSDCLLLWSALMGACQKWVNVELGRWAFEHAVQLDNEFAAAYISMSNIYAAGGMLEEVEKIEALRRRNRAWKMPGRCWWTDGRRNVQSFTVGDKSHPHSTCIYAKLKDIGQKLWLEGYSSRLLWVSHENSENEEEDVLCEHTEKLAIACALIDTPEGTPIRVTKNLRVCDDCHFAISLISKMEKRKIQVTDANRVHIFEDGNCICKDYW